MKRYIPVLSIFILTSCSQNTKEQETDLNNSDIIISKYYGDDSEKFIAFEGSEIKCKVSQVIDGVSCMNNIYLDFIPLSNTETVITNITGQMKWQQNGKITPSPFYLTHITPVLNEKEERFDDSSNTSSEFIADKFKKISGVNNSLMYNIEFSDSTYKNIPINVDKVIVDFQIDLTTNGKTKHYNKSIDLNEVIHKNKIPTGRND